MRRRTVLVGAAMVVVGVTGCTSSSSGSAPSVSASAFTAQPTAVASAGEGLDGAPAAPAPPPPADSVAPGGSAGSPTGAPAAKPSPVPTGSAAAYLNLVLPVDMHLVALGDALGSGVAVNIRSNATGAVAVESGLLTTLKATSWPLVARTPMASLVSAQAKVVADLQTLADQSKPSNSTISTLKKDQAAASSASKAVREAFKLPVAPVTDGHLGVL